MGDLQRHIGVLLDQHNRRGVFFIDLLDDAEDLLNHQRRKPQRRLVQHQQLGMGHQRPADDQHLQFAAAAVSGQRFLSFYQRGEVMIDHFQVFFVGFSRPGSCSDAQIFFDGQVFERLAAFQHLNDALARDEFRRLILNVHAVEDDVAVGDFPVFRLQKARYRLEGRGLSRAVAAEKRHDMPARNRKRHAFEHLNDVGINDGNIIQLQKNLAHKIS